MKKYNRILAALLTLLMLVSVLVACDNGAQGSSGDSQTDAPTDVTAAPNAATEAPADTEPAETDRSEIKDGLPEDLTLGDRVITVLTNARLLDIDGGGMTTGEIVNDAVYERTLAVQERLDFKLEVVEMEGYIETGSHLLNIVNSGEDVYQFTSISCNGTMGQSLDYVFMPVEDNTYLDFDQPWWWKEAILEGSIDGKTIRYFFGDANLSAYNYTGAILFNKTLFENGIGSSEDFYQLVIDRKWTFDKMAEYATQLHQDLNGNETVELEDLHGLYLDTKEYIKFFEYATNLRRYSRDAEGIPTIDYDVEYATAVLEKLYSLIKETPGVYWDPAQSKRNRTPFASSGTVFFATILGDMYNPTIRNMTDPYGIVPYPMYDEAQGEYTTFIHNSSGAFAIPITNSDPDAACAVLEAFASESYRSVINVYFETGLKTKYSSDTQSGQCVDIIRSTTRKYLFTNYSGQVDNCGFWITDQIVSNSTNFSSAYAVRARSANRMLDRLVKSLTQ